MPAPSSADSPIDPPPEAIARYAKRGTTVVEADAANLPLPPLPRTADGGLDRDAIVGTLRREQFGTVPELAVESSVDDGVGFTLSDGTEGVFHNVRLTVTGDAGSAALTPKLFRPAGDGPFRCFVLIDHRSVADDTAEAETERAAYWAVPQILAAGCATVAIPVDQVDPDDRTPNFDDGIHALVSGDRDPSWTTLAAWAWAMSQTREAVQTLPQIGPCIAIGHSRGGKTALWASAADPKFAGAVSNNSGCGGAALSRRRIGETVAIINRTFPHWFNARFKAHNDREADLPHDQHWLLAATAPRPLAVGSAAEDYWADPYGEWLAACAATAAWDASFGDDPLAVGEVRTAGPVQYHLRPGGHALGTEDWSRYLDWAKREIPLDSTKNREK